MRIKALLALLIFGFGTCCVAQSEGPSSEKVLRIVQNGLKTCNGVQKVQREGSSFRVYEGVFMREFDIDDITSAGFGSGLSLTCDALGCVTTSAPSPANDGSWKDMGVQNLVVFHCPSAAEKIRQAIEYYKENFQ